MAKKQKPATLDELEARVKALETHNGWTPPGDADSAGAEPPEPVAPPAKE